MREINGKTILTDDLVEVNEFCTKSKATRPTNLIIQYPKKLKNKSKKYKSPYGENYPRTVFVNESRKIKKSESFSNKIANFFGKSTKRKNREQNVEECVKKVNVSNVESDLVPFKTNNKIINPVTWKHEEIFVVNILFLK